MDYDQPKGLLPLFVPPEQYGFDVLPALTGAQFLITKPRGDVLRGILVCMHYVPANSTAKRLLIGSVLSVHKMAYMTFLRRIGTLHPCCLHTALGSIPGDLIRNMGEIGCPQVCVHRTGLEAHGGNAKLFIGKLTAFMILKTEVHGSVNLLFDVTYEALPCATGRRRQLILWHASLFQALSDFGFSPAFFTVPLLAFPQSPVEGAVLLAIGGGDEIGDADINADDQCIRLDLNGHSLIVRESQPPGIFSPVERHTLVELAMFACFGISERVDMVTSELDWNEERVTFVERADF